MMKYSSVGTRNLAIEINKVRCITNLNSLIIREGCIDPMPIFILQEVIIDMDCVERKLARNSHRNQNKSMDGAILLTSQIGTLDNILLVEFRFNYVNLKNLKRQEMLDKVIGSTNALSNSIKTIYSEYIFIFNSNLKQQAIRRFRDLVPSMPTHFIATDIISLKSTYF